LQYLEVRYSSGVDLGEDITTTNLCDTLLQTTRQFNTYQWSTGEASPTIRVTESGVYHVTTTDDFGFESRDSVRVIYPQSNFEFDTVYLCMGDSVLLESQLSTTDYIFSWNNDSVIAPNIWAKQEGKYILSATDSLGCTAILDSVFVVIDSFPTMSFLQSDTTICLGNSISIPTEQGVTYVWNDTLVGNSIVPQISGIYRIQATNQNSCISRDSISVTIQGQAPVVNLQIDTVCQGQSTLLSSEVLSATDSLYWIIDNAKIYETQASVTFQIYGSYPVEFRAYDSGCFTVIQDIATVKQNPIAEFSHGVICPNQELQLYNESTSPENETIEYTLWSSAGFDTTSIYDPSVMFYTYGEYTVQLHITSSNGCTDSVDNIIHIPQIAEQPSVNLLSPISEQVIMDDDYIFRWEGEYATNYKLEFAYESDFDSTIYEANAYNNFITSNIQYPHDSIYWRVKAYSECGDSSISGVNMFVVSSLNQAIHPTAWYRADHLSQTAEMRIDTLYDKSGNENHFVQSAESMQPFWSDSILAINQKPAITFSGSQRMNTIASVNIMQVYVVFNWNGASTFPAYNGLINGESGSAASTLLCGSTNTSNFYNEPQSFATRLWINTLNTLNASPLNTYKILKANATILKNIPILQIGDVRTTGAYWRGNIAEILIFDRILSTDEENTLLQYLEVRYSSGVDLGEDITTTNLCDTLLQTTRQFNTYQWSTGEASPTIRVTESGVYHVTTTDDFGFESRDSVRVIYPQSNFEFDTVYLCMGDSVLLESQLSTTDYIFSWNNDSVIAPNIWAKQEGKYILSATDSLGCTAILDSVFVVIDSFPTMSFLQSDTTICLGNSISIPTEQGVTYVWNDTLVGNSIVPQISGIYRIQATNQNSCISRDSISVTIQGQAPVVNLQIDTVCQGQSTLLSSEVLSATDSLYWIIDNAKIYETQASVTFQIYGSYPVEFRAYDSGCFTVIQDIATVKQNPIAEFSHGVICPNQELQLYNESTSPENETIEYTLWSSAGFDTTSIYDPSVMFYTYGEYTVQLHITSSNGCTDSVDNIIHIPQIAEQPSVNLLSPISEQVIMDDDYIFRWEGEYATNYKLEFAYESDFDSTIYEANAYNNFITSNIQYPHDSIYWRVKAYSECGDSSISGVNMFVVSSLNQAIHPTAWYRADHLSQTAEMRIDTLYDKSGNENHFVQSAESMQPFWSDSILAINQKPAITFSGSQRMNTIASVNIMQVYVVFNWNGASTFPAYNGLINGESGSAASTLLCGSTNTSNFYNEPQSFATRLWINTLNTLNASPLNTYKILKANATILKNIPILQIGDVRTTGAYWRGNIAEILIFDRILSTDEENTLLQYLEVRYSSGVDLGEDITTTNLCDTLLQTTRQFNTYQWSTGEASPTIRVTESGVYHVTTTDDFGFESRDSVRV
jgi:hypothetical protein